MKNIALKPYIAVIAAVFAASFSAIFIKLALMIEAPPIIIAFYRLLFTYLIVMPYTIIFKRDELFRMKLEDLALSVLSGVLLALHFLAWITSLSLTSTFGAVALVSLQPIFVVAASYFLFKEKISMKLIFIALFAILGSFIIGISNFTSNGGSIYGDVLAFLGALFVAGYLLCGKKVRKRVSVLPYLAIVYESCTFTLFIIALLWKTPLLGYDINVYLLTFALAVVCTIFGHSIYNWALEFVPLSFISISCLGEPIFAGILSFLFFGEIITIGQLMGGIIIILSLGLFVKEIETQTN